MINSGTSIARSNVYYWKMDDEIQNFGDFISKFLTEELFYPYSSEVRSVHIVGSVLDDMFVPIDELDKRSIVFWGCGLRGPNGISESSRERVSILSVRGPLSAANLKLDNSIPVGDPALLVPALYQPKRIGYIEGHTICIPHFYDTRSDEEIRNQSGCDYVIRTNILPEIKFLEHIIDCIVSSNFVITSSLHGAIVAAAFAKPFAYWYNENIDLPFKWYDFAKSVNIPVEFVKNLKEGYVFYNEAIKSSINIPNMLPTLIRPPLPIRIPGLLKVIEYEFTRNPTHLDLSSFKEHVKKFVELRHIHEYPIINLINNI